MFLFAPLLVLGAIGLFCWLLFTLAVFALPTVAGLYAGIWAFHTGAGGVGAILVGLAAAGATFGIGQWLLIVVPWTWAKLLIIAVYTAPAVVAGYCATHGITLMAMSSPVWQTIFSVIGAIAVGITALLRISGMAAFARPPGGTSREITLPSWTTLDAGPTIQPRPGRRRHHRSGIPPSGRRLVE
jgi:hypothetical protein